jgi:hypothetical protein
MKNHYRFTDAQMAELAKKKITEMDLFKMIKLFDPEGSGETLSQVNLYYYIDEHGNYNDPPVKPHKIVARMFFDNLGIKQKIAVSEYLESWEEDFEDE